MKKVFSLKPVAALIMALVPLLSLATSGQITYTATYDNTLPRFGTDTLGGVTYTTVKYNGLFNHGTPGAPSLPVDQISFSVPYNATNFTVTATVNLSDTRLLEYPVYPLQSSNSGTITQPDNGSYGMNPYPAQAAWVADEGMMAGENHIVNVAVLPWIYRHTTGNTIPDTLRLAGTVSITLSYELTNSPSLHALIRKGASLREEGYMQTSAMVVNPNDVRTNAASHSISLMGAPYYPYDLYPNDSVDNPYTYIIITTPELVHSMRRLASLKMQKGINVKILTLEEAMNDSIGSLYDPIIDPMFYHIYGDAPEKIRNNLRTYYAEYGCKYVLLAGSDVPYRSECGGETDHYYSELIGPWNYQPSPFGQLGVGRLLGSQSNQFDNYTNKLFRYELNPGDGDHTYLKRELSINFDGVSSRWSGDESTIPTNSAHMLFEDSVGMIGSDVIELISDNHYGIASAYQKGTPAGIPLTLYYEQVCDTTHYIWAIDSVKIPSSVIDHEIGNGFNCLDNKKYPMIFMASFGTTMPYSHQTGYDIEYNCGESFTMGKDYGGPAYIGMTGNVYGFAPIAFEENCLYYFKELPIGDAVAISKSGFNSLYEDDIICCANLLGDPFIRQWTELPQQYSNITITRNDNSITINGIDVPNTTIGYHDNDGVTGSVTATTANITLNDISPNSTIMLYKHNYIPYIAPLVLQNTDLENSQYVIASDVVAGKAIDNGRTPGNVTVVDGAEFEIEASGKVVLNAGFNVERGATFTVRRSSFND